MDEQLLFNLTFSTALIPILQIIWIDLILSGDNAIVIALACKNLSPKKRRWGLILGTGVAIALRIFFAGIVTQILDAPYVRTVGGILLLWIAIKLLLPEKESDINSGNQANTLWKAILTIAIADAAMSLDNVIAVAAVAHGSISLIAFGVLFSIPLLIIGSSFLLKVFDKYPILIWFGGALLGWISGHLLLTDPATEKMFTTLFRESTMIINIETLGSLLIAIFVVLISKMIIRYNR